MLILQYFRTFFKPSIVIKIFLLSIFEGLFYTDFTVYDITIGEL